MQSVSHVTAHRLDALADGVYAIAATLLVLELKVPALPEGAGDAALRHALTEMLPKVLVWLLSFWVMAAFWVGQQRLRRYSTALDRWAVQIELAQLALVSLLPFTTALIGEFGDLVTAAAAYSANLVGLSLLSLARVSHLVRQPQLQSAEMNAGVRRTLRLRSWALVLLCGVAFGLAFVSPGWNMLALLPAALVPALANRAASRSPTGKPD